MFVDLSSVSIKDSLFNRILGKELKCQKGVKRVSKWCQGHSEIEDSVDFPPKSLGHDITTNMINFFCDCVLGGHCIFFFCVCVFL